jgi:hypothetical protein
MYILPGIGLLVQEFSSMRQAENHISLRLSLSLLAIRSQASPTYDFKIRPEHHRELFVPQAWMDRWLLYGTYAAFW